jgi:hypothetical protein
VDPFISKVESRPTIRNHRYTNIAKFESLFQLAKIWSLKAASLRFKAQNYFHEWKWAQETSTFVLTTQTTIQPEYSLTWLISSISNIRECYEGNWNQWWSFSGQYFGLFHPKFCPLWYSADLEIQMHQNHRSPSRSQATRPHLSNSKWFNKANLYS